MKPTTIQMICFNFFAVINEVKVFSVGDGHAIVSNKTKASRLL